MAELSRNSLIYNGPNPLKRFDSLDYMNELISSSPGRQASSTPPMPLSTQPKRPCLPVSITSAPTHHSGYATTFFVPIYVFAGPFVGIPFPEFDHKKEVIDPFSEDENRDQAFQEELTEMLLDALIKHTRNRLAGSNTNHSQPPRNLKRGFLTY
ncbi:hypothetical protein JOM56_009292 [Amanita muscaria]